MTAKNCLACERPIKGRTDKKFCDDSCRNSYNNRLYNYSIPVVRNINNILRKNRKILEDLVSGTENKRLIVERRKLVERGFQFEYFTQCFTTKENEQYYYCYEYGYKSINSEKVLAVKDTRKKHFSGERRFPVTK